MKKISTQTEYVKIKISNSMNELNSRWDSEMEFRSKGVTKKAGG